LPEELLLPPLGGPVEARVAVPGSKSITNRALLLAALADGEVLLTGALEADDPHYMRESLERLGFQVRLEKSDERGQTLRIVGRGGRIPAAQAELFTGNAGTAMRFLAAAVCLGRGRYRLDGGPRMRQRPISDLIQGLRALGVDAKCDLDNDCPPVTIRSEGLPGGRMEVDGTRSSQYLSAALLAAPCAREPLTVAVRGEFVSRPYVELTLRMMSDFGVATEREGERVFKPGRGPYRARSYAIEGDATAASYFLAVPAILGGRLAVTNLRADSPQGDVAFASLLEQMGCRVRRGFLKDGFGIEVARDPGEPLRQLRADLNSFPDLAQTLAAVALFASGPSRLSNLANLRIKETDRLHALAAELTRLGAQVLEGPDFLEIAPGPPRETVVETYDDHRMAMALALVALARPGIVLKNPACVAKTYPRFFEDLERLRK
jgi:3-phosphoshikimate 1-carboxyvinyltransferase